MSSLAHSNVFAVPSRKYRPELHGVRGLALLGVVLFHLFGNGRVSGGIDIFLTITGFLFVGMLLRETTETGRVSFSKYFGRIFRRIFIPAAIVIITSAVVAYFVLPATQTRQMFAEARASLLYFENFELIRSQLAYGAAGPETSVFQHFWSLSVQGQVYLMLPFLFLALILVLRKANASTYVRVTALVLTLVLAVSLWWAIVQGSYAQDEAYLSTWTRLWQFAFGGLVALVLDQIRMGVGSRFVLGWLGLAMIAATGFIFDGGQMFPGPWAFWPLLGWLFVMIAGDLSETSVQKYSSTRFLTTRPVVWFADRSYGIYLWHWPVLIFYLNIRDREAVGLKGAAIVFVIALVLASIMYVLVERPLAPASTSVFWDKLKNNKVMVPAGVATMVIGGLAITPLASVPRDLESSYSDLDSEVYPGAEVVLWDDPSRLPEAEPFPELGELRDYAPPYWVRDCHVTPGNGPGQDVVKVCDDEDAPENPTATIVLAGGSHAGHWESAFKALGKKYGWEVLIVVKGRCVFGWAESKNKDTCDAYLDNFIDWLSEKDVDLVVTPGTRLNREEDEEFILDEAPDWWQRIVDTDTSLMLMRGTARVKGESTGDCLASGRSSQECGPEKKWAEVNPLEQVKLPENAAPLDMTEYLCPAINDPSVKNCEAIVGNIVTMFDRSHFTAPFMLSMAQGLENEMEKEFSWLLEPYDAE